MSTAIFEAVKLEKYFGDHQVFHRVSLSVQRGEVVVIIGPSGSGKVPSCVVATVWRLRKKKASACAA